MIVQIIEKMASRWSSEFNMTEYKDLRATTMAMDPNGDFILLAGKRHIAIKNLNDSLDTLKKFPRNNKYEIGRAEWNPTASNSHLFALSINQKVEIFQWKESNLNLMHSLKFHTRLVSDLNWHKFDSNLLASASLDSFAHVWDLRDSRKPVISYSAIAGAHHVRWNKLTAYLLGTAHDGDIRIWDQRKGTAPLQYISAHGAKIHDLDWSQTHEYQLASCSQDGTVRFFDVTHPKCAESVIQVASPIWRARYTPFGEGLVTVLISLSQKNENGLLLWNLSNQSLPVHTFVGHTDVVLEFEWRKNKTDLSDFQLITWSKDQSLRIWRIEPFLQKLCGYDFDRGSLALADDSENISSIEMQSAEVKESTGFETIIPAVEAMNEISFSNFDYFQCPDKYSFSLQDPSKSLELEFYTLSNNFNSSNVKFVEMNVQNRICILTVTVNSHIVTLKINFPQSYPVNAAPSFKIDDSSTLDDILRTKVLKLLKQTAQQRVKKYKICLESCLTQLINTLEHSVQVPEAESKPPSRLPVIGSGESSLLPVNSYFYETVHDVHVPFPKTCGARFCSVDKLVCFYRPSFARGGVVRPDVSTPRSFSALVGNASLSSVSRPVMYMLPNSGQDVTDGSVSFYQDRNANRSRSLHSGNFQMGGGRLPTKSLKNITVYDCSKLFFANRELGENYTFDIHNTVSMCKKNAEVAGRVGRTDLVQIWTLASLITAAVGQRNETEEDIQWTHHPFFKSHIEYLIMHYARMSDIQTAAMLCCAFTAKPESKNSLFNKNTCSKSVAATRVGRKKWKLKPGGSPYHTIHPADTNLEGWNFPAPKHNRSNSWSESLDDLKAIANILEHKEVSETDQEKNKLLDDKNILMYDEFKRKYAEVLHRWNLLEGRVQVSKFLQPPKDSFRAMEFLIECQQCKKQILRPPYCSYCRRIVLRCAVCRISVRGSSNFCFVCGHGGHTKHITDWFKSETVCPTGCGCKCVTEVLNILES